MKSTLAARVTRNSTGISRTQQPAAETARPLAEICVPIQSSADILEARKLGRELAGKLGFTPTECTLIATAISELARNVALDSGHGEVRLIAASRMGNTGIVLTVSGMGPHLRQRRNAGRDAYSDSRGLGLGLPGVKRIMDEFEIITSPRNGTTVTVKKWRSR